MRIVGQWLGIVAAMVVATVVFRRMDHAAVLVASLVSLGMAAWVAGPDARQMAQLFRDTLSDLGISIKEAAIAMDLSEAAVSRQLACVDQLSMSRWCVMPRFVCGLALRILREDGRYTIVENGLLARMVNKMEDLFEATTKAERRVA